MADEPTTEVTVEATGEAPAATETAPSQEIDWETIEKAIDAAPPEKLRKLNRFQGILGSSLHQAKTTWEQERQAAERRQALEQAERDMLELARTQPLEFAERYLTQNEAIKLQKQIENAKQDTAASYMHQIGRSYGETFKLTEDDVAKISEELAGKSGDEVLSAFAISAAKIVTAKEAAKMHEEWKAKELKREREALKQEIAAEMLAKETSPSIAKSRLPANVKPHQLSDEQFDKWYERNVLNGTY